MEMKLLAIALVALIVGLGAGYAVGNIGGGSSANNMQIATLQQQVTTLQGQVSTLNGTINSLQSQISAKDSSIADLQSQITSKNSQISSLNSQVTNLTNTITQLQAQIPPLNKGAWNLIETFTGGNADMVTDFFYISGADVRVNWTWTSSHMEFAMFSIYLYKQGESIYTSSIMADSPAGYTYVHSLASAYYYLDISGANIDSWTVTVEMWVPA